MKEGNISKLCQIAASKLGARLFRNQRGQYKDGERWISYGVGPNGASDLIGLAPVKITQEMVGTTIAIFLCVEVKKPKESPREDQDRWIKAIRALGGRAGIARGDEDVAAIVKGEIRD